MFGMLSVLAELQRELIVANTRDGLAAARARGRAGGRRPRLSAQQVELAQQMYDAGEKTVQQIADIFGVPRSTVYGHLNKATIGRRPASAPGEAETKPPAPPGPTSAGPLGMTRQSANERPRRRPTTAVAERAATP